MRAGIISRASADYESTQALTRTIMNQITEPAAEGVAIDRSAVKHPPSFKDRTGQRFGRLTCIEYIGNKRWKCRCDCGAIKGVQTKHLISGSTVSCRCHRREIAKEVQRKNAVKRIKDITGRTFGRLTVLRRVDKKWECVCTCGNTRMVARGSLIFSRQISCGCFLKEKLAELFIKRKAKATYNTRTRLYKIWSGMKQRCFNPKSSNYSLYGGRGITVSAKWAKSFSAFKIDMGEAPTEDHTLDRIDTDGNYCKENCRWATMAEQARNRRDNNNLEAFGETRLIADWSRQLGVSETTICGRLKRGWSSEDAVSQPARRRGYKLHRSAH